VNLPLCDIGPLLSSLMRLGSSADFDGATHHSGRAMLSVDERTMTTTASVAKWALPCFDAASGDLTHQAK
jgi:hypothetical protein